MQPELSDDGWFKTQDFHNFDKTINMPHPILLEDWSSYDNRKIKGEKDASKFSCTERWEVEYLADKLKKTLSFKISADDHTGHTALL